MLIFYGGVVGAKLKRRWWLPVHTHLWLLQMTQKALRTLERRLEFEVLTPTYAMF